MQSLPLSDLIRRHAAVMGVPFMGVPSIGMTGLLVTARLLVSGCC